MAAVHLLLWSAAFLGAFLLRFDFAVPPLYQRVALTYLPVMLACRLLAAWYFGAFHGIWRYTGARDLIVLLKASTASTVAFALVMVVSGAASFPRTIFVIDWLGAVILVGGLRFGIRRLRELVAQAESGRRVRRNVLIVGAGDAGEALLRDVLTAHVSRFCVVGFADDDPAKLDGRIHGVPVLGTVDQVPELVDRLSVDEVIIAMPSAEGRAMRRVVDACAASGARILTVPTLDSLIDGRVSVSEVRQVAIEDLLGRKPVSLDLEVVSAFVRGKAVMVTGAGGSIGSELCRQVARFGPSSLVLVERAENALFEAHRHLRESFPETTLVAALADVGDEARMEEILRATRTRVIFHAAAHKHVPLMEANPGEAVKNNVLGTRSLALVADRTGVEQFVMISTDKAVNPVSVMGASKRAAEMLVQALARRSGTQFTTVRFGNVLGSAGSVIPIFQEQVARRGPVTVTHPEMRRYFMTIPEACQLVLQAAAMGAGGEIFVLDMGEPVRIVDLARDLIRLSGFVPDEDIPIVFTGMRPGEKLFEEVLLDEEVADRTRHPSIWIARSSAPSWAEVERKVSALGELARRDEPAPLLRALADLVPEYEGPAADRTPASGPRLAPGAAASD